MCTTCGDEIDCFGGVSVGTAGATGPQGPAGATGATGPAGPAGEPFTPASQLYYFKELENQRPITGTIQDSPIGTWIQNNTAFNVTGLKMTGLAPGKYWVDVNLAFICGVYPSGPYIDLNYELKLNTVSVPFSARTTSRRGGTPEENTHSDRTMAEVTIGDIADVIDVSVYASPNGATALLNDQVVLLQSGSIVAHRKTVT
tara:strand:- start:8056 stop:8658 length:603 start_codon:yes stop_codon:yes gene_type:complete